MTLHFPAGTILAVVREKPNVRQRHVSLVVSVREDDRIAWGRCLQNGQNLVIAVKNLCPPDPAECRSLLRQPGRYNLSWCEREALRMLADANDYPALP